MHEGKQVLRYVNNCKTKDSYLIGNEIKELVQVIMIQRELNLMYIIKILIKIIYIKKLN